MSFSPQNAFGNLKFQNFLGNMSKDPLGWSRFTLPVMFYWPSVKNYTENPGLVNLHFLMYTAFHECNQCRIFFEEQCPVGKLLLRTLNYT